MRTVTGTVIVVLLAACAFSACIRTEGRQPTTGETPTAGAAVDPPNTSGGARENAARSDPGPGSKDTRQAEPPMAGGDPASTALAAKPRAAGASTTDSAAARPAVEDASASHSRTRTDRSLDLSSTPLSDAGAGIAAITVTGTPVYRVPAGETLIAIGTPTPSRTPTRTPTSTPTRTPTPQPGSAPVVGGCQVLPSDNPWNTDVSAYPVHPNSANYIASINAGGKTKLHPDWGGAGEYGIPFIVVPSTQPLVPLNFTAYGDESDPGPYPIPLDAPIEGGPSSDGDRHVLAIRQGECVLYELGRAFPRSGYWDADVGAKWPLNSNALRPMYWTSVDAAGLPILPGLVRYDEVAAGQINHAVRFTAWRTQRGFILPATHYASSYTDANLPPMGLRLRMKASYDISGYTGESRVVLEALKKYGMMLADNGSSWYITGAADPRWDDEDLNQLKNVPSSAFEAVYTGDVIH